MLYREVVLFHCCVLFPNMDLLSQFVCYTVDGYLACQLFFFFGNLGQMSYSLILAITYPNDFFFPKTNQQWNFLLFPRKFRMECIPRHQIECDCYSLVALGLASVPSLTPGVASVEEVQQIVGGSSLRSWTACLVSPCCASLDK